MHESRINNSISVVIILVSIVPTDNFVRQWFFFCYSAFFETVIIRLNNCFSYSTQELKAKSFDARKCFQLAIICVRAAIRIKRLHTTPEPLSTLVARTDPYRIKVLRKVHYLIPYIVSFEIPRSKKNGIPRFFLTNCKIRWKVYIIQMKNGQKHLEKQFLWLPKKVNEIVTLLDIF